MRRLVVGRKFIACLGMDHAEVASAIGREAATEMATRLLLARVTELKTLDRKPIPVRRTARATDMDPPAWIVECDGPPHAERDFIESLIGDAGIVGAFNGELPLSNEEG